jgi:hypothetical protein
MIIAVKNLSVEKSLLVEKLLVALLLVETSCRNSGHKQKR